MTPLIVLSQWLKMICLGVLAFVGVALLAGAMLSAFCLGGDSEWDAQRLADG